MTKFYFNKLFETESVRVGQEEVNIIRLSALTTTREDRGIEPDLNKTIFGVPYAYKDIKRNTVRIQQLKDKQKSHSYPNNFSEQKEYTFSVGLDYDFTIQTYTYVYFSTMDIVSKLGGLGATIKMILAFVAPIMVLKFMVTFAQIILRKAGQKVRIFRIKDIMKQRKVIIEKITVEWMKHKNDPDIQAECKKELEMM